MFKQNNIISYRIVRYKCGCEYKLSQKQAGGKCPVHGKRQESVTLFCADCGKKLKVSPKAGYNQKRCFQCSAIHHAEVCKENWRTKYAGIYKQKGIISIHKEPDNIVAKRIINEVFMELRQKYMPPVEAL